MEKGINLLTDEKTRYFGCEMLTVLELHRKIQNEFDDDLDFLFFNPTQRHDNYTISINKPYKLTLESFGYLKDGVIFQGGLLYDLGVNKEILYNDYQKNLELYKRTLV